MHIMQLTTPDLCDVQVLKTLMHDVHQYCMDVQLFLSSTPYAKQTLDLAEETDREDLMMLAIQLRAQLGFLNRGMLTLASRARGRITHPTAEMPLRLGLRPVSTAKPVIMRDHTAHA